jgi:DNA primase
MSVTDDIRARLDIVQFLSQSGLTLRRAGRNYTALCPFHTERTPSFVVFPDSQRWQCFGACGEGGDIFNFVMKRERVDFLTALKILAEKAGIPLEERTPEATHRDSRLEHLRGIVAAAADYFQNALLHSPQAAHARAYLQKRALSPETVTKFKIGYAPDGWQTTLEHLRGVGFADADILESGLLSQNDAGRAYDRFRNRLMIPIFDERGQIVGFGARALDPDDTPKYLNSPQSALFDKSSLLYGLHAARRAIRESETAVIVEGYMDALAAHQAGHANVVAQMGTALTPQQLKLLSRYARTFVLALDPDVAGAKATMRGLEVIRKSNAAVELYFDARGYMQQAGQLNIDIRVASLPPGKDPDEVIRADPAAWPALIAAALPVADYVINVGAASLPPNAPLSDREALARELLPILMATENAVHKQSNIQQLAYKLKLGSGRALVEWAAAQIRLPNVMTEAQQAIEAERRTAPESLDEFLVAALLQQPTLLTDIRRKMREIGGESGLRDPLRPLEADDFPHTDYRAIFTALEGAWQQFDEDMLEAVVARLPAQIGAMIERLLLEHLQRYAQRVETHDSIDVRANKRGVAAAIEERQKPRGAFKVSPTGEIRVAAINAALSLRRGRLKRENDELYALLRETPAESAGYAAIQRLYMANIKAIAAIDRAVRAGKLPSAAHHSGKS